VAGLNQLNKYVLYKKNGDILRVSVIIAENNFSKLTNHVGGTGVGLWTDTGSLIATRRN
jgi:hypothetical protein